MIIFRLLATGGCLIKRLRSPIVEIWCDRSRVWFPRATHHIVGNHCVFVYFSLVRTGLNHLNIRKNDGFVHWKAREAVGPG